MQFKELHNARVIVTGGAGFIGSELTAQLIDAGAFVTVVDDLSNGKESNLARIKSDRLKLVVTDIRDRLRIAVLMRDVDIVFHLAALGVRHSIHSPLENHEVNATGALGLLLEARKASVKRFVHVSTSEVYGTGYKVPMDEEHPSIM